MFVSSFLTVIKIPFLSILLSSPETDQTPNVIKSKLLIHEVKYYTMDHIWPYLLKANSDIKNT